MKKSEDDSKDENRMTGHSNLHINYLIGNEQKMDEEPSKRYIQNKPKVKQLKIKTLQGGFNSIEKLLHASGEATMSGSASIRQPLMPRFRAKQQDHSQPKTKAQASPFLMKTPKKARKIPSGTVGTELHPGQIDEETKLDGLYRITKMEMKTVLDQETRIQLPLNLLTKNERHQRIKDHLTVPTASNFSTN